MALPLTVDSVRHIKDSGIIPLGVAFKSSINYKGDNYTRTRVTYDCYLTGPSGLYVNKKVLRDTLQPCLYGFYLLRILHMVEVMRLKCTSKYIWIEKKQI